MKIMNRKSMYEKAKCFLRCKSSYSVVFEVVDLMSLQRAMILNLKVTKKNVTLLFLDGLNVSNYIFL